MITLTYRLNIYQQGVPQVVHLSQYDSDFTLIFGLYSSFGTFTLEEGTTAELRCTKPDGNGYSKSGTVSGTTVTIEGDNQLTACSGCFPAEITLFKNEKELNTVNFTVSVERAALDAGTIESETVLEELQAIIDGAATATQAASDAQDAQEAAEAAAASLVIDPTLTHSGQAADAKATGDAISDLNDQINKIAAIFTLGNFININGIMRPESKFAMSNEISLAKGYTITAYLKSFSTGFSAVAVKNTDGTYTKKVESDTNSSWGEVTYTATADCVVVLSTWSDDGNISKAKAYIYVNGENLQNKLIDLQNQIDATSQKFGTYVTETLTVNFNEGHYVDYQGTYRGNSDFSVSDPISITKSQVLSYTAKGAGVVVALLARLNDDGTYTPIVNCTDSNPAAVLYQSDRNQRVVISTNKSYTVTVKSYYNDNTFKLLVNDAVETVPKISQRQKWFYANKFNDGNFDAELNMFICYGQSWAEGYDAHAISLTRRYDNIMLNTGVKNNPLEDTEVTAVSFSPMVEADGVGGTQLCGETPVSSQCNMVKQLIEDEDGYLYTDFPYQMIGIAPGYGSQSLAQLSKGTNWYTRLIDMVTAANSIAAGLGKKLVVQAFSWAQNAKGSLTGTYAENLEQLRSDIDTDVKAITGQTQTVKCITWQTFLYEANGAADCYAKYVGASETYPNIICAGASYQFPHINTNNLHLTSLGQLWSGSMFGVAYKRTIIDGEKFVPLKPISATYSGNELFIKFNVPQKPLKIDTDMVASVSNYGFNITNGGTEKTINSVTVINPDTVRIICAENIASDDHITYSQNAGTSFGPVSGNRGNLRDSQGDYIQYTAEDGAVLRIDNWCVVFDKTVASLS